MFETLKTLVLKTATVTGVKLVTPADRIGLGLGVANYPTDNLSPGPIPMPQSPEPEQARSRQLSAMQMQRQMQSRSDSDAVPPAGSTGCSPGSSAGRFSSSSADSFTSWHETTRTAATGDPASAVRIFAVPSRTDLPGDLGHNDRLGDCQSPELFSGKRESATRRVGSAADAGK